MQEDRTWDDVVNEIGEIAKIHFVQDDGIGIIDSRCLRKARQFAIRAEELGTIFPPTFVSGTAINGIDMHWILEENRFILDLDKYGNYELFYFEPAKGEEKNHFELLSEGELNHPHDWWQLFNLLATI